MTRFSHDRQAQIMAAALSRRRAIKGLLGGMGVGLGLRTKSAQAQTDLPILFDFAAVGIYPRDLSDPDEYAVSYGVTFRGPSGAMESRAIDDRMTDALGESMAGLVGGHFRPLVPVDGSANTYVTSKFLQFSSNGTAQSAEDGIARSYFAGTNQIPTNDKKGRYFSWMSDVNGESAETRAILSRNGPVVFVLTDVKPAGEQDTDDLTKRAIPSDSWEEEERRRKMVVARLQEIATIGYDGLSATLPTAEAHGAITHEGFNYGINAWYETYLAQDGEVHRHTFQSLEDLEEFINNHPDIASVFSRSEVARTPGGKMIDVRVDAYRHNSKSGATTYFEEIEQNTAASVAEDGDFTADRVDGPPVSISLPAIYFNNTFHFGSNRYTGVSGWFHSGVDVTRVMLVGPESDDLEFLAALMYFLGIAGLTMDARASMIVLGTLDLYRMYLMFESDPDEFNRACRFADSASPG